MSRIQKKQDRQTIKQNMTLHERRGQPLYIPAKHIYITYGKINKTKKRKSQPPRKESFHQSQRTQTGITTVGKIRHGQWLPSHCNRVDQLGPLLSWCCTCPFRLCQTRFSSPCVTSPVSNNCSSFSVIAMIHHLTKYLNRCIRRA